MNQYYVYILGSLSGTLYVGVTNNLVRRVLEHRAGVTPGFTSKYQIYRLLLYEESDNVESAILRERQIKRWSRQKKIGLIELTNPLWLDLAANWYERDSSARYTRSE